MKKLAILFLFVLASASFLCAQRDGTVITVDKTRWIPTGGPLGKVHYVAFHWPGGRNIMLCSTGKMELCETLAVGGKYVLTNHQSDDPVGTRPVVITERSTGFTAVYLIPGLGQSPDWLESALDSNKTAKRR